MLIGINATGTRVARAEGYNETIPWSDSEFSGSSVLDCSADPEWAVHFYADDFPEEFGGVSRPIITEFTLGQYPYNEFQTGWYYDMEPGTCERYQVRLWNHGLEPLLVGELRAFITDGNRAGFADISGQSFTDIGGSNPLRIEPDTYVDVWFWIGRPYGSEHVGVMGEWRIFLTSPPGIVHITKYAGGPVPGVIADGSQITDPAILAQLGVGTERPPVPGVRYSAFGFYGINEGSDWDRIERWGAALTQALEEGGDTWDFFLNTMFPEMTGTAWTRTQLFDFLADMSEYVITSEPTDVNGETTLDLPRQSDGDGILYFVWESETPCELPGQEPELCAWPGQPFFVTVPRNRNSVYPDGYEVWAYPKNEILAVHKDLIDGPGGSIISSLPAGNKIGDEIFYRVTMSIPKLESSSDEITELSLIDQFFGGPYGIMIGANIYDGYPILKPLASEPDNWGDWDENAVMWECAEDPLDPVSWISLGAPLATDQAAVQCRLTADGLEWVDEVAHSIAASGDAKLVFEFSSRAYWQMEFPNGGVGTDYFFRINDDSGHLYHPNTVNVAYGGFSLWKYALDLGATREIVENALISSGNLPSEMALQAQFQVYAGACPANPSLLAGPPLEFHSKANNIMDLADIGNLSTDIGVVSAAFQDYWTVPTSETVGSFALSSGADGQLIISGLAYGTYCVRETAVFGNYVLPTGLDALHTIKINKPADGAFYSIGICSDPTYTELGQAGCETYSHTWSTALYDDDLLIPNSPRNAGFPFPITGGSSSLIYAVLAGAIVAGTLYVVRKQKKFAMN